MRVEISKHNPEWITVFNCLQVELKALLKEFNVSIDHVGSTAVPDLSSKPIIDVLLGLDTTQYFDEIISLLLANDYVYYQKLEEEKPYQRFLVKLKKKPSMINVLSIYTKANQIPDIINQYKLANIYIMEKYSEPWIRHLAFRDFLKTHPSVKQEYEQLKFKLNCFDYLLDNHDYNSAKNTFINQIKQQAFDWYCCKCKV